jgi:hypothetical protein
MAQTLIRRNAGSWSFSVTGVPMVPLSHGQTDTYTRIQCVIMGMRTSHTTWSTRTFYRRKDSLSFSMVSEVMENAQSRRRHTSMFWRHQSFGITALNSSGTLNERFVSMDLFLFYHGFSLTRHRSGGDRRYSTLQSPSQGHSAVIESGESIRYFGGTCRGVPRTGSELTVNRRCRH